MRQSVSRENGKRLCSRIAWVLFSFILCTGTADCIMAGDTGSVFLPITSEPVLSAITPASATISTVPKLLLVRITAEGTDFRFPDSKVSFSNEAITVLFTLPVTKNRLWAVARIGAGAAPGIYDVTVTTGEETAIGVGLFELKDSGGQEGKRWTGNEKITVRKEGTAGVETALNGLPITEYDGKDCVRLSDIVKKSAVTTTPEKYFYNFIAADSFSVKARLILRGLTSGLPPWEDMQKGYIYDGGSTAGLSLVWEEDTVASKSGAGLYNVRLMQGGIIELLDYNVP